MVRIVTTYVTQGNTKGTGFVSKRSISKNAFYKFKEIICLI
jgi:hypothetical protein